MIKHKRNIPERRLSGVSGLIVAIVVQSPEESQDKLLFFSFSYRLSGRLFRGGRRHLECSCMIFLLSFNHSKGGRKKKTGKKKLRINIHHKIMWQSNV